MPSIDPNAAPLTARKFVYNRSGRATSQEETIVPGSRVFTTTFAYDNAGRLIERGMPGGVIVQNVYANGQPNLLNGTLATVRALNAARNTLTPGQDGVWSLVNQGNATHDAFGNTVRALLGNGVVVNDVRDGASGRLFKAGAGTGGNYDNVHNVAYAYDWAGNTKTRTNIHEARTDTFEYDIVDRLTAHAIAGGPTTAVSYNAIGNILTKSDLGGYSYLTTNKPHAVRTAGGATYTYDTNGNVVVVGGDHARSFQWNAFNQPRRMTYSFGDAQRVVEFNYDDQDKRIREVFTVGGGGGRVLYLAHPDNAGGLAFEQELLYQGAPEASTLLSTENRYYIQLPGTTVQIRHRQGDGSVPVLTYLHKDALGSTVSISNQAGGVVERPYYDAWGRKYRNAGSEAGPNYVLDNLWSATSTEAKRGYTEHEQLFEVGLTHMNGRLYDAVLGRFLSADVVVQDPSLLQSYNAYSYVLNNPLKYNDPSGHVWEYIVAYVIGAMLVRNGNEYWQMVGTALMIYGGYNIGVTGLAEGGLGLTASTTTLATLNGTQVAGLFAMGAVAGATTPGANGGDILLGGIMSLATFSVGSSFKGGQLLAAHALLGCVRGMISGGKCGPSAAVALVSKGASMASDGLGREIGAVITTIAGGTASVIGGGKFASGAAQAAFQYLFNQSMSDAMERSARAARGDTRGFWERLLSEVRGDPLAQQELRDSAKDAAKEALVTVVKTGSKLNDGVAIVKGKSPAGMAAHGTIGYAFDVLEFAITEDLNGVLGSGAGALFARSPWRIFAPVGWHKTSIFLDLTVENAEFIRPPTPPARTCTPPRIC